MPFASVPILYLIHILIYFKQLWSQNLLLQFFIFFFNVMFSCMVNLITSVAGH
ncbi:hypothetical protein MUK42_35589 [Musa troglodytarum]|uniref:Uncharacterized protein n=1 Tax=Musa troglodytarum TaxID=320322 RepID=A0A9E7HTW3_9LILI|nr:hypothetical protein MUK42_35589 [Musa troglodytarum]